MPNEALRTCCVHRPCPNPLPSLFTPCADNVIRKQAEDALGHLERSSFVRGVARERRALSLTGAASSLRSRIAPPGAAAAADHASRH